ncbi:MAG: hypothetical protein AAF399_11880 [Bacteroidota bacterium]
MENDDRKANGCFLVRQIADKESGMGVKKSKPKEKTDARTLSLSEVRAICARKQPTVEPMYAEWKMMIGKPTAAFLCGRLKRRGGGMKKSKPKEKTDARTLSLLAHFVVRNFLYIPINQSTNQPINQSTNQPINQSPISQQ